MDNEAIVLEDKMEPIEEIAAKLSIPKAELEFYGKFKAKIPFSYYEKIKGNKVGKLVLVTAISPTSAGEGKTTTSIGLTQALAKIGKKVVCALREPSLGPVFGIKGGATGGGMARIVPKVDIDLHFTGDIHAITSANNLLAAMIDNHVFQGNALGIKKVLWRRCMDMNDRALRRVRVGLDSREEREDGFDISTASEVMAIFCLASDLEDLKKRLGNILVGMNEKGEPVYARDLKAEGAMAALLKDAINPNLVQTVDGVPAIVHGGPFANIAHGTNSIISTRMALRVADYVITEAGFGSDLGAEKYFDIVCRNSGFAPDAVVVVATIRALKLHGGINKKELENENIEAMEKGFANLKRHVENMRKFGLEPVVAINRFTSDSEAEIKKLEEICAANGMQWELCEGWAKGGEGAVKLAEKVLDAIGKGEKGKAIYELELPIEKKIEGVVKEIYRGDGIEISAEAKEKIANFERWGFGKLPVCIAKTQYSFSDDPKLLNAPLDFVVKIRDARLSAGAGFVVVIAGEMMTMPGLPKKPVAEQVDVRNGK
ncbi:formate--tetrahydrofolate ligase, partial [Candidatus Micrarchaeota archaeon]|nr:formate--tetrahydrofolate ligase [Candidatus Micrarchaeota archaeon]